MNIENDNNDLQSNDINENMDIEVNEVADLDQHQGAESDTASEPEHEQKSDDGADTQVNQDSINAAVARQHAKYREEQRKREALEAELAQLRQGSAQSEPEPKLHEIDPYADDVQEQIKLRDESLRAHIAWQQRQQESKQQQSSYQEQQQLAEQQTAAERSEAFMKRAAEQKVDQQTIVNAVQTVGQYQLGKEVAEYLMNDEDLGVQMVTKLSKDPVMLAELSLMQPHERLLHLERNVRSRMQVQPRRSQGKPPAKRVEGRASSANDKYPLTGGKVTIE